jgi:thymidine kinase
MTTNMGSYLEIILGGMYAGKTSRIVEIYKQCMFCNIPVIVINHHIDNRYDDEMLSTHDKVKIPCTKTNKLLEIDVDAWDVILINEGQFFPDLYEFVNNILNVYKSKKIYVCGLDGDFERRKFGQILDIIPLCDKVTKLTSLCSICKDGTPGIFSKRLSGETEQTVVGFDNYIPVCRRCYEV